MSNQIQITPKRFEKDANPKTIAGLIEQYYFGDGVLDPTEQWRQLGSLLGEIHRQKNRLTYGVSFDLENGKGIEYLCGIEVSDDTKLSGLPDSFVLKALPSFTYAVFNHDSHVSRIPQTCDLIWKQWFPRSDYQTPEKADFFFERYGEKFDANQGKGDIEIWVPVEK